MLFFEFRISRPKLLKVSSFASSGFLLSWALFHSHSLFLLTRENINTQPDKTESVLNWKFMMSSIQRTVAWGKNTNTHSYLCSAAAILAWASLYDLSSRVENLITNENIRFQLTRTKQKHWKLINCHSFLINRNHLLLLNVRPRQHHHQRLPESFKTILMHSTPPRGKKIRAIHREHLIKVFVK